ncbi:TolC family protein [Azospirillum sp. A26]|uniref:TolC family protein n=1 Tax=Azospirillum sp. A26 TaxID=3160607 RepID=UPI0036731A2A
MTPEPLTVDQQLAQVTQDRSRLFVDQEPVTGPITMAEAMARAIKYNLDSRQALMEEMLQNRQLDVTSYDMLPRMAASAGFVTRSPANETYSRNTTTNFRSVEPAISQDKDRFVSDLGLTWNILDFGVSYYQANQQANRVLIAHERRRRLVNSIIQQVRGAFWLAAGSERMLGEIDGLLVEARQALKDAASVEEQYQRRINSAEVRKAMLRMLPGISFNPSLNYDSNSYLLNNAWAEAGARVTLNLFNLVSGPANIRAAEAQVEAGDFRRLALSMATLTQVHVALQQYQRGRTTFERALQLESIEKRINENVQKAAASDAESPLERIRAKAAALGSQLARDRAYAELQNAVSSLYVSLGLDPIPETVQSQDIKGLTAGLTPVVADWTAGRIPLDSLPVEAPQLPTAERPAEGPAKEEPSKDGGIPVAAGPAAAVRTQLASVGPRS